MRETDRLILELDEVTVAFAQRQVEPPASTGTGPGVGPAELTGTTWELDGTVEDETVSPVPAGGRTPTLTIDGDEIRVDTGCNRGRGPVAVTTDTLEIGPLATTRMACPDGADALERQILAVLDGPVEYRIEGATLTITNGDTGLVLRAAG